MGTGSLFVTLSAGSRLGPYEVLAPLGAGGMGEVYRARDTRLAREVAIKVLPAEVAADPGRLERFEKEARSASALNHANIVTIYDVGSANGVWYIAMERVEGRTLRERMFAGSLPLRKLLPIATQIADGLAKAHEAGIVHRDLKPENVMVTKDGFVKILDFGLAKWTSSFAESGEGSRLLTETGTAPGTLLGTVGYMSPEQAAGQPLDFRSDQFSLGSLLYEMCTGMRAFEKKTAVDTLAAILNAEPEPIATVSPRTPAPLRWIIERCHAKSPADRYDTTRDLARELAAVRDHLGEISTSGETRPAAGRRARRTLPIAVTVGMLALAGSALFAWLASRRQAAPSPPTLRQVTFVKENIHQARFGPDGDSVVYTASVDGGPLELFRTRLGAPEAVPLHLRGMILSISSKGEMAIRQDDGKLVTVSVNGGTPRVLLDDVQDASWSPDGRSLAVLHEVDDKLRLEFPIGKVLYEEGGSFGRIRFSRTGREIAVGIGIRGGLKLVDLSGKARELGPGVPGGQWSPDGNEIWFSDPRDGATNIRGATFAGRRRLVVSLPGDLVLQDVSPSGRMLLERGSEPWRVYGWSDGTPQLRDLSYRESTVPGDLSSDGRTLLFSEKLAAGGGSAGATAFVRPADGSPPRRLGEGWGLSLSPDGKWALSVPFASADRFVLLPTEEPGGASKEILLGGLMSGLANWASFLPDGQGIVFSALAVNRPRRLYVLPLDGGTPRPITPEGVHLEVFRNAVSLDGKLVVAARDGEPVLCPIDGGEALPIPGLEDGDSIVRFADASTLYVLREEEGTIKIWRLDIQTGHRKFWREIELPPADPGNFSHALMSADGKSAIFAWSRWLSDLWVVEGGR